MSRVTRNVALETEARREIFHKVFMAEVFFHQHKFTLGMLEQIDPALHEAVTDQYDMFYDAYVFGEEQECILHGEAMVRGWAKAILRLEDVVIGKAVELFPGARVVRIVEKPRPWEADDELTPDVD